MVRPRGDDLQADEDISQAQSLISRLRGLSLDDSAAALHDHAALTGVSIHTAALAVLAEWRPAGKPHRRIPTAHTYTTVGSTGRIVMRWQGREKAHLMVTGVCSDGLAARLRSAVDSALRAGATQLTIDTRRSTGADVRVDHVVALAGRRLWARRGVLVVRANAADHPVAGLA